MPATLNGGCLCGAIRYTISADVTELRACHCTSCQKMSGTGNSVNAIVPSKDFKLEKGALKRFSATADSGRMLNRYFCGDCGSHIYSQREVTPERMVVRAGTIENAPPMKITSHLWTKSKRPWSHIDPASSQLPGQSD
jgi:hypothetical protein